MAPAHHKRLVLPEVLEKKAKPAKWVEKLFSGIHDADTSTRKSTRMGTRTSARTPRSQTIGESPFFALPLDIRDRILHYTLAGTIIRFRHYNTSVMAQYTQNGDESVRWTTFDDSFHADGLPSDWAQFKDAKWHSGKGLPGWMMLNKRMLQECVHQFHREAIFWQNNFFFTPIYPSAKPLGLFRLDKARIVRINTGINCHPEGVGKPLEEDKYTVICLHPQQEVCTKQFTYHLTTFPPVLQILSLSVYDFHGWQQCDSSKYAFRSKLTGLSEKVDQSAWKFRSDLTFLERLPKNLQKITFEVVTRYIKPSVYPESTYDINFQRCLRLLKDELRRIGEILVGGDGALATEEVVDLVPATGSLADSHRKLDTIWGLTITSPMYRRAQLMR
ncbi:uncharacterized protein J4E84_006701 [Alternaria hordeiaustralica]|uniref:uncharacterized protein n=1 Tax=Alternaria hordeiaustralica TaxID=1187925 RepID=UPI0020C29001|nr:uncharacterized protein J4E84_006701 [Alternaria hordeiaustralica]KAI4683861.1 hypothetical protein J4E84_006701 [Alternaria hordeiaustralica]